VLWGDLRVPVDFRFAPQRVGSVTLLEDEHPSAMHVPSLNPNAAGASEADFDEVALALPPAGEVYADLQTQLALRGPDEIQRLAETAQRLMRDLGVTFALYADETSRDRIVPMDLFPRVIDPATWDHLSRGLVQRTRVWDQFFRDVYDSQEALKNGIIPFELVYDDPHFQRNAVGLAVPEDVYVHTAAYDLARDAEGRWVVIEDYVGNVTGTTYALQARHVLGQAAAELLETASIHSVSAYPTELLEHLRSFARGSREPRVVLLSPGTYNSAYYEHAYLARQMGIPLVRGSDLIVLNSRCYLKTISGLEPIDVIYRRLDEKYIDPVAFQDDSTLGVPGLLLCVRKGTVMIANAVGTGLGDNRALASLLPRLARFYFRESLLLPTVERLLCFDPDQREMVESDPERWVVQHAWERSNRAVWHPGHMGAQEREKFIARIRRDSALYVAEPSLPMTTLPSASARLEPRHAGLRVFVFGGRQPRVVPLALTRTATEAGSRVISSGLGGGIRDTWVLRGPTETEDATELPLIVTSPQRRLRLGSRIADSLFWMGRYKARTEQTTRMLQVMQRLQMESAGRQPAQAWVPLWEAIARATGHEPDFFHERQRLRDEGLAHYLLLDLENPGSVASCVFALRNNAQTLRESIPPEVWSVINRLHQQCEAAMSFGLTRSAQEIARLQEFQQHVLDLVDMLNGSASNNMLHDDAWHFWRLGRNVERALTTTLVTRQVLLKRAGEPKADPHVDHNLDALLRMLSCQYAFRSLFQARPTAPNVVTLLLQDPALPRSVIASLQEIRASLEAVGGQFRHGSSPSPLRSVARLVAELEFAELRSLFVPVASGDSAPLATFLEKLADQLTALSIEISDHYLYHQAVNVLR
jgi:uncharacterized circularly permuted ATP-grasp superfamily protein/uncharacterized alpha-E superfamily protein